MKIEEYTNKFLTFTFKYLHNDFLISDILVDENQMNLQMLFNYSQTKFKQTDDFYLSHSMLTVRNILAIGSDVNIRVVSVKSKCPNKCET